MSELTIEQKIVEHLANLRILNNVGDVTAALKNPEYANFLVIGDAGGVEDCDHESLSNPEIQEVFDNDATDGFH